ncbi:hypothetical protein GGTG_11342 [Gaeumannomyces tritici R3-111a-1]|uniref:Uncharacterized protein n=1 Tax=Gaeumannomyces tritici (strain R3-111a-1) TaxID=644352 RepID=J3PCX3_GAET3|nr:hypothetical protein GGTG_11342 [Gaeumannomyces tritici R3-111a-1]EJT72095.1 hypothetical protein GGTG_11342 [Gaeumannomyces tritici R3-111a-1]
MRTGQPRQAGLANNLAAPITHFIYPISPGDTRDNEQGHIGCGSHGLESIRDRVGSSPVSFMFDVLARPGRVPIDSPVIAGRADSFFGVGVVLTEAKDKLLGFLNVQTSVHHDWQQRPRAGGPRLGCRRGGRAARLCHGSRASGKSSGYSITETTGKGVDDDEPPSRRGQLRF